MKGTAIAKDYGKQVQKDKTIYELAPSDRRKYVVKDFKDVVEAYLATKSQSSERSRFVEERKAIKAAAIRVSRFGTCVA